MSDVRTGKQLIEATRPFAKESRGRSWFHLAETFGAFALCLVVAGSSAVPMPLRMLASIVAGLVNVRAFILYHDHLHGALLKNDWFAKKIFFVYGLLTLTPVNVWRQTHNYHHAHTAKIVGSHVGSYAMITVEMWNKASPRERLLYRVIRHPLTIAMGYLTIFLYGMCISGFRRNPKKNWDSLFALVLHVALVAGTFYFAGSLIAFLVIILPMIVACASGAYLFYAQHNFPDIEVQPRESWEFTRAALESSSFMRTGKVMGWFTGNIGYHHVHHLNPSIPFYRLEEAMAAIPELQNPHETTLSLRDITACFKLKLWDPEQGKMVGYP